MTEIDGGVPTAAGTGTIARVREGAPTRASLTHRVAAIRDEVGILSSDTTELHRVLQSELLDERTAIHVRRDPRDLLEQLASDQGLSWEAVARMVGVTGAAVRKWRRGDTITAENRRRLAHAVAFLGRVKELNPLLNDPAAWLEIRISDESILTPLDIYAARRADLLLDYASDRVTAHGLLDSFDANWRTTHAPDNAFVVVEAPDGMLSVVPHDGEH